MAMIDIIQLESNKMFEELCFPVDVVLEELQRLAKARAIGLKITNKIVDNEWSRYSSEIEVYDTRDVFARYRLIQSRETGYIYTHPDDDDRKAMLTIDAVQDMLK